MDTAMEIQFCDLCNESVPVGDLAAGRAYLRKGRVVCADCDAAMGGGSAGTQGAGAAVPYGSSPLRPEARSASAAGGQVDSASAQKLAQSAPRGGGGGGVLVGLLTLVFATAGFTLMVERMTAMEQDAADGRRALQRGIDGTGRDQRAFEDSLPAQIAVSEQRLTSAQESQRAKLVAATDALRLEFAAAGQREDAVAGELRAIRDAFDKQETASRERLEAMRLTIVDLEKDIRFYSDRTIELEETLRTLSARGPLGVVASLGALAQGLPANSQKAWEGLLADLQHTNAGIRLDAIYALGETGDQGVIRHLVPMLTDVDLFVRMATARMLEDLDARAAVPALIDALADSQSAVREASMVALRQITGKEFRFEPVATDAERGKKVKLWRDWWKKSGDAFLAGS